MKKICIILLISFFINITAAVKNMADSPNLYIPKEINLWLDKEFFELFHCQPSDVVIYATNADEKMLLRQIVELMQLQLKTNLMLIKQNERIINLLEKIEKKKQ
ncbi:MAG: hypothetical protein LWW95_05510 [Candidatus Desulfofervidus auxilii]|nr:hypothetical protein [Candidatus Desulfofervidus auxilii]